MCRQCEQDPYLAGCVVLFVLTWTLHTEDRVVQVERSPAKGYTGVCVRHHRGRVTIKTKRDTFQLDEDDVLAFIPKEEMA